MKNSTYVLDLRFGLRVLLKKPVFTTVAIFMLATGIGANTAIYSVLRATVARPLAYKEPERLVWLANTNRSLGVTETFLNPADILDYREQASSFEQIASWGTFPQNLIAADRSERLETIYVTTNFFETLGVEPALGRDFVAEDAAEDGDSVIISHSLWQRQFGQDPDVIGRKIRLGDLRGSAVVVGVMPTGFNFPPHVDLFSTYEFDRAATKRGGTHNDRTIARLAPGVTIEQAQAEISRIALDQSQQYPDTNGGWGVVVTPLRDYLYGSATTALPMLMGAVFLVLLIASTNVASLQLARAVSRQKEIAVRLAVGAARLRIVRQLLTESAVLSATGGALGLLIAFASLRLITTLGPATVPGLADARLDPQALWFTLAISLFTTLAFGLWPALQASRLDLTSALNEAKTSGIGKRSAPLLRNTLVVIQIALALVLLAGAGLLIKSFWKLQSISPGFESDRILSAGVSLNLADYRNGDERRIQFFKHALERVANLPGVEAAGAISHLPLGGRTLQARFRVEGDPVARSGNDAPLADYRVVTPSLFATLGIGLRKGRSFTEHDTARTARALMVNEAFARTYLAGREAVGVRVEPYLSSERAGRIIGVVADVKHRSLEEEAVPTIYVSYLQESTFPIMIYTIRTRLEPELLGETVRRELQSIDPNQVVFNVRALPEFVRDSLAPRRFSMVVVTLFAVIAVSLAGAGIYSVMAFIVAERTHELGIRLAIGAQQKDLMMLVLGWG
ncbi:MAG TPA: ABC transporter permease, partial [Blastocatellia bacterium]|nr:ABC transporter permease [Blastocatellia bacterium]